jgi:D-alanyl-D-alanine carboxypeptidase/D-alanyl-D-alanine-endopeptidase (penicillin-binding protein 4)
MLRIILVLGSLGALAQEHLHQGLNRVLLPIVVPLLLAFQAPHAVLHPAARAKAARGAALTSAIRLAAPSELQKLVADLSAKLARAMHSGRWGVLVVSLSHGDTLFGRNADDQLLPASTMKLFTSAVALDRFGPDARFKTEVLRAGVLDADGVLRGDLVLKGAGDPTLTGTTGDDAIEPPMDALARQIADAGVRRVSGAIVGDASAFEHRYVPDGWLTRYLRASYAARVSALSFNENRITVVVQPAGRRADVSFEPAVSGVPLSNEVKVVSGSRGARLGVREDSTGRLYVTGWIGSGSRARGYAMNVEHPELFAAGALRAALIARGVTVDGPVVAATAPDDAVPIAELSSPTLQKIITQMNVHSNNHFAELLFRNAARDVGVAGSAENANTLLRRFLFEKANVEPTVVFAADGSGLSTLDRVTPRSMVQLLDFARHATWGPALEQSLPVAGETETLRRRMRGTAARGNLHAKTGSTSEVASLGGYVTAKNGEQLAFSFIYNGDDPWRARSAIDAMGATLARFSR